MSRCQADQGVTNAGIKRTPDGAIRRRKGRSSCEPYPGSSAACATPAVALKSQVLPLIGVLALAAMFVHTAGSVCTTTLGVVLVRAHLGE